MWIICYILTLTDVVEPGDPIRTDLKDQLIQDAAWIRFPYPCKDCQTSLLPMFVSRGTTFNSSSMGNSHRHAVRCPRIDSRSGVLGRGVGRRLLRLRENVRGTAAPEPRRQQGDRDGGIRVHFGGALGDGQRHHQLLGKHWGHIRDQGEKAKIDLNFICLDSFLGPTQVGSLRVVQTCGFIILLVGLICKFGAFIIAIPEPIIGGILVNHQYMRSRNP